MVRLKGAGQEDDAKRLGFISVAEMTSIQAQGFKSKSDYEADIAKKKAEVDRVAAEKLKQEELIAAEKQKQEDLIAIDELRKSLTQKVSTCGWKSPPESAGFFLGMTLAQASSFASANGYNLNCKESAPITGGSVTEMVQKMLNDEFSVNRDWRASNLCETRVDGNEISLYFFKTKPNGEPLLAKAYNSLNKYRKSSPADTYMAANPVISALSDKFGFDVNKSNECSVDTGKGYVSKFSITFARPFPDRSPSQPNISLFFTAGDESLIQIGGAITKARDDATQASKEQAERENLRQNASKL